jgi:hypothetical protein
MACYLKPKNDGWMACLYVLTWIVEAKFGQSTTIFFVNDVFDGKELEKTHVQPMYGKNLESYQL